MHINVIGINYRTAPVTVREKVAIRSGKLEDTLSLLRSYFAHGILVSTCNRTEIYATEPDARNKSLTFLNAYLGVPGDVLSGHLYSYEDEPAIKHLFRVTAGLDSMVLGEYEVLGQIGTALETAEKAGMVSLPLRQLFRSAVRTGRLVREKTGVSRNALSVSSVAVELASQAVGSLEVGKLVVIGAGEAGRLVARTARERGALNIAVTSRTIDRATSLAESLGGTPFSLEHLEDELRTASVVIACADAPHCILNREQVAAAMSGRPHLPLVVIDIAVPRNVDPSVKEITGVFLYNIDDLEQICERNRKQRESEIVRANEIIEEEEATLSAWWHTLETRHIVTALMSKAEAIRLAHLNRTMKKLRPLSDDERESLEAMTKAIVTRLLCEPIEYLKANGNGKHAIAISELFRLNEVILE